MKRHSEIVKCPRCGEAGTLELDPFVQNLEFIVCESCGYPVPVANGIPNFAEPLTPETESLSIKQRIMETRLFATIYETPIWRPLHTYVSSGMTIPEQQAELLALAGGNDKDFIVDLACGTGHFTRAFAERWPGAAVFGLDLSMSMLRQGRSLAVKRGAKNILYVRGSIFELPFADSSVDLVNCCGALHLFHDQKTIWREVSRILRPGGVFTAEAVAPDSKIEKIQELLSARRGFRFLDPEVVRSELAEAGLEDMTWTKRKIILTFRVVKRSDSD